MRDLSQWTSSHLPWKKHLVINVEALRIIGAGKYRPGECSERREWLLALATSAELGNPTAADRVRSALLSPPVAARADFYNGTGHPLSDTPSVSPGS